MPPRKNRVNAHSESCLSDRVLLQRFIEVLDLAVQRRCLGALSGHDRIMAEPRNANNSNIGSALEIRAPVDAASPQTLDFGIPKSRGHTATQRRIGGAPEARRWCRCVLSQASIECAVRTGTQALGPIEPCDIAPYRSVAPSQRP